MNDNSILLDRLAGGLILFFENYELQKKNNRIKPSYFLNDIEYEYLNSHINELSIYFKNFVSLEDYISFIVCHSNSINDLPHSLKELTEIFEPRFFRQYPEYIASTYFVKN